MRLLPLALLATFAPILLATAAGTGTPEAPVPILGAWWTWVSPAVVVPEGTPVLWIADTKHTVTTADSLDDAIAGNANDRTNSDGDPDTFDVALSGGPLSETFRYQHAFDGAGDHAYFCRYHFTVGMVGLVSVAE